MCTVNKSDLSLRAVYFVLWLCSNNPSFFTIRSHFCRDHGNGSSGSKSILSEFMAVICSRAKASLFAILIGLQNIMWVPSSTRSCLAVRPACLITTTSDETRHILACLWWFSGWAFWVPVRCFFFFLPLGGGAREKMGVMLDVW